MTTDPARLLQMLEPAVRPGGAAPNAGVGKGKAPFEARSFQDLLSTASTETPEPQAGKTEQADPPPQTNPLLSLSGLGQIENATLREVLTQAKADTAG